MNAISKSLAAVALLLSSMAVSAATPVNVMAWGTKPTARAAPYVNALRFGCPNAPETCLSLYDPGAGIKNFAIAFTKAGEAEQNLERAHAYSELSKRTPALTEIGIDDLWDFISSSKREAGPEYLLKLINAAKSSNPKLRFGATVYEIDLDRIRKDSVNFPAAAREKIDRVAFYLRHRGDISEYRSNLSEVAQLFPNAEIYAGVYHYDRRLYRKCSKQRSDYCSPSEEVSLFKKTLSDQLQLIKEGALKGIELYPGFIGEEENWKYWSNSSICAASRREECIRSSKEMSDETLNQLRQSIK